MLDKGKQNIFFLNFVYLIKQVIKHPFYHGMALYVMSNITGLFL
uniref:Uncharacterized protein n=1 Tax=Anguilla anguilla TaxID=7936 RepID=A0A0E9QKT4_ANGAN